MSAVGVVEGVEIAVARGVDEVTERVPGRVTLLSLAGPGRGPHFVTLVRVDGAGTRVVGGRLVKTRSAGVFTTPLGQGAAGTATGNPAHVEDSRQASSAASPSADLPAGWAAAAALSEGAADDEEAEELPRYGDRVDHFVFGLCDVMVVRGERMKIKDVHGPGRLREIHVGAVKVLPPTVLDGKRVFRLARRT